MGYLPINNDGVRWRLVAVTTALFITAAAGNGEKFKNLSYLFNFKCLS